MQTAVGTDLLLALELLEKGQLVSIPTETVYGLAADANNEDAVLSIFKAKERPTSNPLILHFAHLEQALPYTTDFPAIFETLYARFCPGPLTFVVPKSSLVSALITGGQTTVALRFPAHPVLQQLLNKIERPLAAPSANLYGQLSPTTAQHVESQLKGRIPYILDGGPCLHGLESTIIGLQNERVVIYRHGGVTSEMLAAQLGYVPAVKTQEESGVLTSGMVKHHYSTATPLFLGYKPATASETSLQITIGPKEHIRGQHIILSQNNSLTEAARNLYACLHQADAANATAIYVEPFPNEGLGKAMNDRLNRAAAKFQ